MKIAFYRLFSIVLLCTMAMSFTSCGKDSSKGGGLIGYWFADNGTYKGVSFGLVYDFIDSNTVVSYGVATINEGSFEPVEGHSGWYRHSWEIYGSYYIEDNRIYIFEDDDVTILIIRDNSLIEEGSNIKYKRW